MGVLTPIRRLRLFGQSGNVRLREKDGRGNEQDPASTIVGKMGIV